MPVKFDSSASLTSILDVAHALVRAASTLVSMLVVGANNNLCPRPCRVDTVDKHVGRIRPRRRCHPCRWIIDPSTLVSIRIVSAQAPLSIREASPTPASRCFPSGCADPASNTHANDVPPSSVDSTPDTTARCCSARPHSSAKSSALLRSAAAPSPDPSAHRTDSPDRNAPARNSDPLPALAN